MVWVWLIFSSVSEPPRLERDELETEKGGWEDPVNWMTRPVIRRPDPGFLCFILSSEIGRGPRADSIIDKKSARKPSQPASSFDAISVCIMHAGDKFRFIRGQIRKTHPPYLLFIPSLSVNGKSPILERELSTTTTTTTTTWIFQVSSRASLNEGILFFPRRLPIRIA